MRFLIWPRGPGRQYLARSDSEQILHWRFQSTQRFGIAVSDAGRVGIHPHGYSHADALGRWTFAPEEE